MRTMTIRFDDEYLKLMDAFEGQIADLEGNSRVISQTHILRFSLLVAKGMSPKDAAKKVLSSDGRGKWARKEDEVKTVRKKPRQA